MGLAASVAGAVALTRLAPAAEAPPMLPESIAIGVDGTLYVADGASNRLLRQRPGGRFEPMALSPVSYQADRWPDGIRFLGPVGLAMSPSGALVVGDGPLLMRVDSAGRAAVIAGAMASESFRDGVRQGALFQGARAVGIDADGRWIVADTANQCIRALNESGQVDTLAGDGGSGYRDGPGRSARFNWPQGVAVARRGDVLVSDTFNRRIRRIGPDGMVSTVAGNGTAGGRDGIGKAAEFMEPRGLAFDRRGHLLVADGLAIRCIAPDGTVKTLAPRFKSASSLAFDTAGTLYVADRAAHRIVRIPEAQIQVN